VRKNSSDFPSKLDTSMSASSPLLPAVPPIADSALSSSLGNAPPSPQTLVFVDSGVAQLETLIAGIQNAKVVILDSQTDGIDQITSVLAQHQQLDSVQIISHGASGSVQLGNTQLNAATLEQAGDRIQSWGNALSATGDLLFYGCNVAAGEAGLHLIQQISDLTQADVQASDDLTGSTKLGGDWDLEVATGAIETDSAINAETQAVYQDTLKTQPRRRTPLASGSFTYNNSQYQLTSRATTWRKAQAEARRLGGNLVIISDAAEEKWLQQTFGRNRQFWTGLSDRRQEGNFLWATGQAPDYTNWAKGQPNESDANQEDFVVMNGGKKRRWDDRSSRSRFRGIIEMPGAIALPPENRDGQAVPPEQPGDVGQVGGSSKIALAKSAYRVNEADGFVEISLIRTGDTSAAATAVYEVESDTATDGRDFRGGAYTVQFNPGETEVFSRIPILNDNAAEGAETFAVLMKDSSVDIGTARTANVTILDDEVRTLDVSVRQVSERDGRVEVRLTRSNRTEAASVRFNTIEGTARAGSDFINQSGTVNFAIGETTKTIAIALVNDGAGEANETFSVNFSNPVGLTVTNPVQEITILDDDATGYTKETLIGGLNLPTAFARTPNNDLMFIAEKAGVIKTAVGNQVVGNFVDLTREVNNVEDRGVLSVAVHPEFYSGKPYVYVAYTYDPPEVYLPGNINSEFGGPDKVGNRASRVVRLTADASTNYRTVLPNSQVVILGKNSTWANISSPTRNSTTDTTIPESGRNIFGRGGFVQDFVKIDSQTHTIGHLKFGADGALYISSGDGSSYILDQRAASSLNIDSLSGKMLRVDPLTGAGLADNPFYDPLNPGDNRSKVWQYGLRNPYRFTFKPGTSTPVIGDVGWRTAEEVNIGGRGANFGWPGYEGRNQQRGYFALPEVQTELGNAPGPVVSPIYERIHQNDEAIAITMGDYYRGELFIANVNGGTVDALTLNGSDQVTSVRRFADNAGVIVFMQAGPEDSLYYVDITGSIGRWRPI
jgi:glucose/arabinose dehydrogenase